MKEWIVYKHTSPSGKVYVGITSNITRRWASRGYYYQIKDTIFARAIKKYGWENFTHTILYKHLSLQEASHKERELISIQKAINNSYNIADGGQGFRGKHSKQHINNIVQARISKNKTKVLVIDKSFNYLTFNSKSEVDNYLKVAKGVTGHVLKQPLGYTCKGFYLIELLKDSSPDINNIKSAIQSALKERGHIPSQKKDKKIPYRHSIETRLKMSKAAKGRDMSKAIQASRAAIFDRGKGKNKAVTQYDLDGNVINEFPSITSAMQYLNKTSRSIQNCLAGRALTAFGYKWKYKDGGN